MTLFLFRRGNYQFCVYASSLFEAQGVVVYNHIPLNETEYICTITRSVAYEDGLEIL